MIRPPPPGSDHGKEKPFQIPSLTSTFFEVRPLTSRGTGMINSLFPPNLWEGRKMGVFHPLSG